MIVDEKPRFKRGDLIYRRDTWQFALILRTFMRSRATTYGSPHRHMYEFIDEKGQKSWLTRYHVDTWYTHIDEIENEAGK